MRNNFKIFAVISTLIICLLGYYVSQGWFWSLLLWLPLMALGFYEMLQTVAFALEIKIRTTSKFRQSPRNATSRTAFTVSSLASGRRWRTHIDWRSWKCSPRASERLSPSPQRSACRLPTPRVICSSCGRLSF